MLDFWRLPGPSAFLAEVLDEIGSGRNVILLLPNDGPHRLMDRLRDALYEKWSVHSASATYGTAPARTIYDSILGADPVETMVSTSQLAADERLTGTLVFVQDVGDDQWPAWQRFMEDYEVNCRRLPVDRRMLIVLSCRVTQTRNPPVSEVALAVLRWNDCVGEIDMHVYAALSLRSMSSYQPKKRQILGACLARIAVWDVAVIDRFCRSDPERILEPLEMLIAMGGDLGWTQLDNPSWHNGTSHQVDGKEQVHSAYLACHDPSAIARRLWSAQASVLLPMIEERRISLLPKLRRYIRLPLDTKTGTVERLEDLEVGHILWQLNACGAERSLIRTVDRLKRARDALAHLEPLSKEMCLHPDLMGID